LIRIFDAHIHCSERPDDQLITYARQNGLEYTLDELLQMMDEYSVASGLLLSPPLKHGSFLPNKEILKLCSRSRGRLHPIFTARPSKNYVAECIEEAKQNRDCLKGFKILLGYYKVYPDDPVLDPLYDYAESEDLPVMFHTGDTATKSGSLAHSHPLTLDPLANRRPALKIGACHFGNPWIEEVAELIYKHTNVFADISGLCAGGSGTKSGNKYSYQYLEMLGRKLSDAIYYIGSAERILFGTDYPVETYSTALDLVGRLKVDEDDKQKILFLNAQEVFGIP
jgi:predicted TIM-barrel fold metal-dependent hydrolase